MAIKLLLIQDVEKLGRSGEILPVKPGFARNFLLPKGLAILADKRSIRLQVRLKEEREKKAEIDRKKSEALVQKFGGQEVSVEVKVDPEGHMYGSVSANDIQHLVESAFGVELEKKSIQLRHPIKQTGRFTIPIRLQEEVECSIELKVIPEGGAVEPTGLEKVSETPVGKSQEPI